MKNVVNYQIKVNVGIEAFWKALGKEWSFYIPELMSDSIKGFEIIEGDGGSESVILLKFGSDTANMMYNKEKVEVDESKHQFCLEVVEGGPLLLGFSHYEKVFQLTACEDSKTLVNINVTYECEGLQMSEILDKLLQGPQIFIQRLESYLLNKGK